VDLRRNRDAGGHYFSPAAHAGPRVSVPT